jgi:hypothetical protein
MPALLNNQHIRQGGQHVTHEPHGVRGNVVQ